MTLREIPPIVVDHKVREYLDQIREHLKTVEDWHAAISKHAKNANGKPLAPELKDLWHEIIKVRNNLNSQWEQLTPSLAQAILTGKTIPK